jgi:hypothetical protein
MGISFPIAVAATGRVNTTKAPAVYWDMIDFIGSEGAWRIAAALVAMLMFVVVHFIFD